MTTNVRAGVRLSLLGAWIPLLLSAPVRAQEVATSFAQLTRLLEPGQTISVTDTNGTTVKGTLVGLSPSSLDVRVSRDKGAPSRRLSERDVNNVVVERADRWWDGPLIGFASGAIPGLLIELAASNEYSKFDGTGAIGLGTVGFLTGWLIDVLHKDTAVVYLHGPAQQSRGVSLAPLLRKSAAGLQMSVRF